MCRPGESGRWRRGGPWLVALLAAMVGAAASTAPAEDRTAALLESLELPELLAVHFEASLEDATPGERDEILRRLGLLYARLLEEGVDPDARARIERRGDELLDQISGEARYALELALLRGPYRSAERTAEDHRLRLASDEEVTAARAALATIRPKLASLIDRLGERVNRLRTTLDRSRSGTVVVETQRQLQEAARLREQAGFLHGWACYYDAWMTEGRTDPAVIETAERRFSELIDPDRETITPEEVSADLRALEVFARSVLGMALTRSLTDTWATALDWLALLDHPETHPAVRNQQIVWQLVILGERGHGRHREARSILEAEIEAGRTPPVTWLRLVAVQAFEDRQRSAAALEVARWAVARLAMRGELAQIYDLAERYGAEALGRSGFAMRYVEGVQRFHDARALHAGDEPASDPKVIAAFASAEEALREAIDEPDADQFGSTVAAARRLIGLCAFFRNDLVTAHEVLAEASADLPLGEADAALWMAIVAADRMASASDDPAWAVRRDELIAGFLDRYPSSPFAPRLLLRRSMLVDTDDPAALRRSVAELRTIPSQSDAHDAARRRLARLLHALYRVSSGSERTRYGHEFLHVAVPIVAEDDAGLGELDDAALAGHLSMIRRVLEVAVAGSVDRPVAARTALEAVDALASARPGLVEPHRDELDCRRVQRTILEGDPAAAIATAEDLARRDPDGRWAEAAARLVLRTLHEDEATRVALGEQRRDELIVRFGRVLASSGDSRDDADAATSLAEARVIAEAALRAWRATGDPAQGELALGLYERRLLPASPDAASVLQSTARLAQGLDRPRLALECWRRLLRGLPEGSDDWFEAKAGHVQVLLELDPARAARVLEQHRALYPELGPEPWGSRLRALARLAEARRDQAGEDDAEGSG